VAATGFSFNFTLDSAGTVFYAVLSGTSASVPTFASAQVVKYAKDQSCAPSQVVCEVASTTIVDSASGGIWTALTRGSVAVAAGMNTQVDAKALIPSASHVLIIVAQDAPGGPYGPNVQTNTRDIEVRTLTLNTEPSASTEFDVEITEGSISESYAFSISGGADGGATPVLTANDCMNMTVTASAGGLGQVSILGDTYLDTYYPDSAVVSACGMLDITVLLRAVDDSVVEGIQYFLLRHNVSGSGRLAGITSPPDARVKVIDNEKASLIFSSENAVVDEGGTLKLSLRLSHPPPNSYPVTVAIAASVSGAVPSLSSSVSFSPATVMFGDGGADWNTAQTINMRVARDGGFAYGARIVNITATATSASSVYNEVISTLPNLSIRDTEYANLTISPRVINLAESGASVDVTIVMTSRPTANTEIRFAPNGPMTGLSDTLTLSTDTEKDLVVTTVAGEWQRVRKLTMSYAGDAHATGPMTRKISFFTTSDDTTGYGSWSTLDAVTVHIADKDNAAVMVSTPSLTMREGEAGSYILGLQSEPFHGVNLESLIPSNFSSRLAVGYLSLMLDRSTWRAGVTQNIMSQRDYMQTGNRVAVITHAASSLDSAYNSSSLPLPSLTLTMEDIDVAAIQVTMGAESADPVSQLMIVEGDKEAQVIRVSLATIPLTDVIVEFDEVSINGTRSLSPLLTVEVASAASTGDGAAPRYTFSPSVSLASMPSASVRLSVADNNRTEGLLLTYLRLKVVTSSGGGDEEGRSNSDQFYSALKHTIIPITVRDDEAAEKTQIVSASAATTSVVRDGAVAVSFPPGALDASLPISVRQLPPSKLETIPPLESFDTQALVVSYGPAGSSFKAPVTITVPLESGETCLDATKHCAFIYRSGNNATSGAWTIVPGGRFTKTSDGITVGTIDISHFSLYTIAIVKPGVQLNSATTRVTFTEKGADVVVAPSLTGSPVTTEEREGDAAEGATSPVTSAIAYFEPASYVRGQDVLTFIGALWTATQSTGDATCNIPADQIPDISFALTAQWRVADGSLTIKPSSGVSMTPSQAGAALATVAYGNPSVNPATASDRGVRFTLREVHSSASTPASEYLVKVVGVNDPLSIDISADVVEYVEDGLPQKVAPTITLTDVDSSQISGAEVWLTPAIDKDLLHFPPGVLDGLPISAQKVSDFRLKLYPVASILDYQAALRLLEFKSFNQNPTIASRTVNIEVTDAIAPDAVGGTSATRVSRNITITPVNDPPVMQQVMQQGEEVLELRAVEDEGPVGNLFLRASDVELNPVTYVISCQAKKGNVQLLNDNTGAFNFTPAPNEHGADTFFAIAVDSGGLQSSVAQFRINIEPRPDLPTAGNLTGDDDIVVYVNDPPVEKNFPIIHPDGLDQVTGIYVPPVKGTLELTNATVGSDGVMRGMNPFKYSAKKGSAAARSGTDNFEYTVIDKIGQLVKGRVSIRIYDWDDLLNTPPVTYGTSGFEPGCVNLSTSNATNATSNATTSAPAAGSLVNNGTNATLAGNASRCVPPYRLREGESVTIVLEAFDEQTQRRNLNFSITQPPEHGSFTLVNEEATTAGIIGLPKIGTLVYTPKPLWHGYDQIRFRASDGRLSSNETTVHFVVDAVNNPPVLACVGGSGGPADSAFLREKHKQLSEHPLCQLSLSTASRLKEDAPMSLGQVGGVYDAARRQLTPVFAMQLPTSLTGANDGSGMFAKISTLANAVLAATAGALPLIVVAGGSTTIRVPMGGGHNETSMAMDGHRSYAAMRNMSEPINAGAVEAAPDGPAPGGGTNQPSSGQTDDEPAAWGTGGSPMFLAVALVSFDPDDERIAASSAPNAPTLRVSLHGLVDPVLTAPPTNGARVYAVNPSGTVGKELTFNTTIHVPASSQQGTLTPPQLTPAPNALSQNGTGISGNGNTSALVNASLVNSTLDINASTPEQTPTAATSTTTPTTTTTAAANVTAAVVPGAVLFVRFADGRRGTTTLRWRARDGGGLVSAQEGVITASSACRPGYRSVPWWWDSGQCVACPSGHYNLPNAVDQDTCAACPPGSFSPQPGSTACYWCDSSTFNDSPGRRACQRCLDVNGVAMLTRMTGRASRRDCECPAGSWVTEGDVSKMLIANVSAAAVVAPAAGVHGNTSDFWAYPELQWSASSSTASLFDASAGATSAIDAELAAHPELATVLPAVPSSVGGASLASQKQLQGGALCTMHDPVKCGIALATATGALGLPEQAAILGDGLCNAAANVRACGGGIQVESSRPRA
jgi:hypothetical protein